MSVRLRGLRRNLVDLTLVECLPNVREGREIGDVVDAVHFWLPAIRSAHEMRLHGVSC
jgi:hypothetical protein